VSLALGLVVDLHDDVVDVEGLVAVGAGGVDLGDLSVDVGRAEDLVAVDDLVLVDDAEDVSAGDRLALAEAVVLEDPVLVPGQGGDVDSLGDVDVAGGLEDVLEGTLDTVENGSHNSGAELHGKRLALTEDGVSDGQTGGILVDLDGGGVALELDDLSDELGVSDTDKLVHRCSAHAVSDDQRSGDLEDESVVILLGVFSAHKLAHLVSRSVWLLVWRR